MKEKRDMEDIQFYSAYARTDINKPFKFELKEDEIEISMKTELLNAYIHIPIVRGKALFSLVEKMDTNLIRKLN